MEAIEKAIQEEDAAALEMSAEEGNDDLHKQYESSESAITEEAAEPLPPELAEF